MGFYDDHLLPRVINVVMNTKQTREIRARVCSDLTGQVVEIGFGTGHNLPYLPAEVLHLSAVEPSRLAVRLAGRRMASSTVPIEVVGLDGQSLPIADDCADSVLCTWSLCTIPDPIAAVAEMRRVLRPGGELHLSSTVWLPMRPFDAGRPVSTVFNGAWAGAATWTVTSQRSSSRLT